MNEKLEILDWLTKASDHPIGLWLEFESPEAMKLWRQKAYQVRKEFGVGEDLAFLDDDTKLWLAKKAPIPNE